MISGSFRRKRSHVITEGDAGAQVISTNVRHHPMEIFFAFVREMSVRVGHDESPQSIRV